VVVVLSAAGAFSFVPQAALSGVLVFIGMRIFRVARMRQIYRQGVGGPNSQSNHVLKNCSRRRQSSVL
jgi:predicted lipid-binding transport protein (Tim44 family)